MDLLAGVDAKLARAARVSNDLGTAANDYLFRAMHFNAPDYWSRQNVVALPEQLAYEVTLELPAVPLELSTMLGDVLHNLRSALDHLSRALVLEAGLEPVDRGRLSTAFPIRKARPSGELDIHPGTWAEARELLAQVQPYNDPSVDSGAHPLALLNELNNVDKHRLLNVISLAGSGNVAFVTPPAKSSVTTQDQRRYRVDLMSGVAQQVQVAESDLLPSAEIAGSWVYTLAIGEDVAPTRLELLPLVTRIGTYVIEDVVIPFRLLLGR